LPIEFTPPVREQNTEGIAVGSKLFGFIPRKTIDDPNAAENRIEVDKFLRYIYSYQLGIIQKMCNACLGEGKILEIGAAGGITKTIWPEVITTDVRQAVGVDKVMSAEKLEFENSSLKCIFGMDALHHVRDPEKHFVEVHRCLSAGGVAIYIEPNWNFFSKFAFGVALKYLHPEPYDMKSEMWNLVGDDPMMGNQAQGYNIFVRDFRKFNEKFPYLQIEILQPIKGLSFLFSGGVHTRLPIPSQLLIPMFKREERSLSWMKNFGLGRVVKVTKL
jgi:SAM-dependent methyltransferase